MIDLHCHILPGVDDGAKNMDQAIAMGRCAWDDGIETIVATPHVYRENISQADFAAIRQKRKELGRAFREKGIPVQLMAGAEVHIMHNLLEEVKKNRPELAVNGGSYMFVEFPQDHVFFGVKELFFDLMSEGIKPIIAHPERNTVFMRKPSLLYDLVRMGAFVQSNGGSFLGRYGRGVEESAFALLERRSIHFIASDGHGVRSIPPTLTGALRIVREAAGEEYARALVQDNPEAVLNDGSLPYVPDTMEPRARQKYLRTRKRKFFE